MVFLVFILQSVLNVYFDPRIKAEKEGYSGTTETDTDASGELPSIHCLIHTYLVHSYTLYYTVHFLTCTVLHKHTYICIECV